MIIFDADDPLVLNGTYDREGYKPGERERIAKAKARQLKLEGADMAKKAKQAKKGKSKDRPLETDTVVQTVEAVPARIDLGPVVLPEPDQAVQVLKGLAELNDRALAAHRRYLGLKDDTKQAKGKWEQLAEEVQTTLRQATHPSELPLLTMAERETDHANMVKSAGEDAPGSIIPDGVAVDPIPETGAPGALDSGPAF